MISSQANISYFPDTGNDYPQQRHRWSDITLR
uniref:Uncharacterized protein n=1 Tax=Anguilla anguilla TaxID=7936 RepID=A0A0E9VWK9_ANGAN